jgi:hypothetical protein
MDTGLTLRKLVDSGRQISVQETLDYLESSPVVQRLKEPCDTVLANIWRLIALSEIPGAHLLDETRTIQTFVRNHTYCGIGFSLTGKQTDILPCYNAMISKALLRLEGIAEETEAGIRWILDNQPFSRGVQTPWKGNGVKKYGGCLHATPCYIGVVKSLAALIAYQQIVTNANQVNEKIHEGREYVTSHDLVFRRSNGDPINRHILNISFPESYQLNIVDVIQTLDQSFAEPGKHSKALKYLLSMRNSDGKWQVNYEYKAKGYMTFDKRGQTGEWVSHVIGRKLEEFRLINS